MINDKMRESNLRKVSRMFLIGFCIVLASVHSVSAQNNSEKITIQQAIDLTLQNNIQIKQASLNESLSDANIKQSKLAVLPNLNGNTNLNFNFGRSVDQLSYQFVNQQVTNSNGGLSSSVTIFQGFQKLTQIAQNKLQLQADKSKTAQVKNDLILNVINTYLGVLANSDLASAAQNQLELANQTLKREQKLFNVGNKTTADISQAQSQYSTAEFNLVNAQNQVDISKLNLAQLMERDPSNSFDVVKPIIDDVAFTDTTYLANDVYLKALNTQPEIALANYNTLVAQKSVDFAKGSLYPRLTLTGSLGSGYSSASLQSVGNPILNGTRIIGTTQNTNEVVVTPVFTNNFQKTPFNDQIDQNFNQSISFGLSIPIFNGLQSRTSVKRAQINLQNVTYTQQLAKINLNKTINQTVFDIKAAKKKYIAAQKTFDANKVAYEAISQRYEVGLVNSLDLTTSKTNFDRAQFDLIQSKYDLLFKSKMIDFYLGNPLTL
jgi:outer membrane protein